jgi:hypothetical protein
MTKKEYRGARFHFSISLFYLKKDLFFSSRKVDAFFDFIRQQVDTTVVKLSTPSDLVTLDTNKRYIIGHFDDDKSPNYLTFAKVASLLKDECTFVVSTTK